MQFRAQISYDDSANSFQILITLINGTKYNFLNYFILAVSQNGSSYFGFASTCVTPALNSYNPQGTNMATTVQVVSPFYRNANSSIMGIPWLKSIQSKVMMQFSTFNATPVVVLTNSNLINVGIYNGNTTFLLEVCITVLVYHQTAAQSDPFIAYTFSSFKFTATSDSASSSLNGAANSNFNIAFQYGPVFEPKCFIGLQSFNLNSTIRQIFSFNISQGGVTQAYTSSSYSISYGYFCIAQISCPGSGMQYYPVINGCEPVCNISMCQLCSSSTSCSTCIGGYFINPLLRCSPCSPNCLNCSSAKNCTTCSPGFFLNTTNAACQVCPIYCTNCNGQQCLACQSGFLATANQCLSCSSIMINCITCSAPAACSLCLTTYYFNSNAKGCVLCNDTMPNCYVCDLPNNCLTCYPGFYLATYNKCSPCNTRNAFCCSNYYVQNCSVCASNTTCQTCGPTYFLTNNLTCSSCIIYGPNCNACTKDNCLNCINGFFLSGNSCLSCSAVTNNCSTCSNSNTCLTCLNPLLLVDNQCYDCPFWPMNDLYFLSDQNICKPCSFVTPQCKKCDSGASCTACVSLYFLKEGLCEACQNAIPHCLTCSNQNTCYICDNGYYLRFDSSVCISCGASIPHCGQCSAGNSPNEIIKCQTCNPEYYYDGFACISCLIAIPFCLQCNGPSTCLLCVSNYFINFNQLCVNCSTILQGCKVCLSKDQCLACLEGYLLQAGFCTPCNAIVDNCQQCSKNSEIVLCNQCIDSYYLDTFFKCSFCAILYENCFSCSLRGCQRCISGYYVAGKDTCKSCDSAIANCIYCSPDIQCLICKSDYWLNSAKNTCDSCLDLSKGCSTCQHIQVTLTINCTSCQEGFTLYPSSNLIFSCIGCNITLINCISCATAYVCQVCINTTFLNQYGTCSLCSLYIPNCLLCVNATQCDQCKQSYIVLPNGSCYYCNLSMFGLSLINPLCSECSYEDGPICTSCVNGYYLNAQQTQCLPCGNIIANCYTCVNPNICISCESGYELSLSNAVCMSCLIPNCDTCINGICNQCLPGTYMLDGGKSCQSCNQLMGGCSSCTSSTCLSCADGYYIVNSKCMACSSAISNCIVCSDAQTCLLKTTPPLPVVENPLLKPFIITTFILFAIILVSLIIWLRITGKSEQFIFNEEMPKFETDRRIARDEVYANQIALDKGKLCQYCLTRPSELMRFQLLCQKCDQILKRGHKHKIRKEIKEKKKSHGELSPIDEEQELQIQSKVEENSKNESKKNQSTRREESTSKKAVTRTTNDLQSIALRNLF